MEGQHHSVLYCIVMRYPILCIHWEKAEAICIGRRGLLEAKASWEHHSGHVHPLRTGL